MTRRAPLPLVLLVLLCVAGCGVAEPTAAPSSPGATSGATEVPSAEPSEATDEPSEEPTPEPTAEPTVEPSGEPTAEPTPEPTPCSSAVDEGPGVVAGPDSDAPPPGVVADPRPEREPPVVTLERAATGLSSPVGLVNAGDGSGRLFVIEQGGQIRVIDGGDLVEAPFLDISGSITAGGERGLLGLAFHPEYAENGRFFVDYTDLCGNTAITEYRVSDDDPNVADPRHVEVLLQITQPFANHNGGGIAFGPDGYLYIGTGDGGSAGDPFDLGQRLDTLLGKLLRIDVDERDSDHPYGIPNNRFASVHLAQPEIYATGLRNPWRFSFDRETGDLWIGDVGQGAWEEVDALPLAEANGANFGWNLLEGRHCFVEDPCDADGFTPPTAEYPQQANECAVTGGYVYRGANEALRGWYLFADYCAGTIMALDPMTGPAPPIREALRTDLRIPSFGEDEDGELYVVDIRGDVYKVIGPPN